MTEVDVFLQERLEDNQTPSLKYILFGKDKIIHHFGGGFADLETQKRASINTAYHAFSVTKTFTALGVLQLMEKKLLSMDEPVQKYLPDFPYMPEITIRQLLTHSAGIPNPIPLSWIHLASEHPAFDRKKFFDQVFEKNNRVRFKPNEKFAYSNLGYVLLGDLIEKVSGVTYEKYITEQILENLGLQSGDLGFALPQDGNLATGYQKRFTVTNAALIFLIDKAKYMHEGKGKWQAFRDYYINGTSYGGLIGTPAGFVKYVQALLNPDCKLISDPYKAMLFTENRTIKNQDTGMCLSWFCGQLNGQTYYSHAGGGGGYYSEIRIYPKAGIGSVIMFNRTGMTDERFLNSTDKYFVGGS